ncbi:probable G-protein coupled receptor 139 [Watersipora subatra]|uniref:probable G-protein coupled receptor 139 n=1 Tax=Watersipora subatra TaxID=2589382 RepID=UPI00355C199F
MENVSDAIVHSAVNLKGFVNFWDKYVSTVCAGLSTDTRRNLTSEEVIKLREIYFWMNGCMTIIISIIGILSNILTVATLIRYLKQLKNQMYRIFLGMAGADLAFMVSLLSYSLTSEVLTKTTLPKDEYPYSTVPLDMYEWFHSWFFAMCVSNWCAVLLVWYRLYGVIFPLKAFNNELKVNHFLFLVYLLAFLFHIPSWLCYNLRQYDLYQTFSSVSAMVSLPIPLSVCAVSTGLLLWNLKHSKKKVDASISRQMRERRKAHLKQITLTLIVIVVVFMATNSLLTLYFMFFTYGWFIRLNVSHFTEHLLYIICNLIAILSYASNFFVYLLGNQRFRDAFLCRKQQTGHSSSSTLSSRSKQQSISTRSRSKKSLRRGHDVEVGGCHDEEGSRF